MTGDASPMRSALTRAGRTIRPDSSAPGIRQVIAERRELIASTRERSQSPFSAVRHFVGTSPGKLVSILVVLAVACVVTGWYASVTLEQRTHDLQEMINRTEPLAEAAQVLYSSLSVADAAASSSFISGGLESPELRSTYTDALATASSSLITAAGSSEDPGNSDTNREINADLRTLTTGITTYSGLIETARTNNRLGNPVGSAYLGQASALMQDQILPAAQRLYESRSLAIADPQSTLTSPPWGVYASLVLVIVALVGTSRYLARRTRRRFNAGILAALVAVAFGTAWLLISGLTSVAATSNARTEGADPLRELTTARILTQQARSAETLSLVRRTDQADLDRAYQDATAKIDGLLSDLGRDRDSDAALTQRQLDVAATSLSRWKAIDATVRQSIVTGNFGEARRQTVGDGPTSSAQAYRDVDAALVDAITTTRTSFRDQINTAQRVLGFTGTGILLLTLFAGLAVILGLIPRIREYR